MTFSKWLDTYIEEADLDLEQVFNVEGPSGNNSIPLGCLVSRIKDAPANEQAGIKTMIVKIDFANADPMRYFAHLAQAIAI
jgi:hypothetical protein